MTERKETNGWRSEAPTIKQINLFAKLQEITEYDGKTPSSRGDYCDAISGLIEKNAKERAGRPIRDEEGNYTYLDDDYLGGDQGIMPGY